MPCDGLCLRSFHIGLKLERGDDTGAPQYNRDACNVLQVPEDLAEYIKVSTELSCDSAAESRGWKPEVVRVTEAGHSDRGVRAGVLEPVWWSF